MYEAASLIEIDFSHDELSSITFYTLLLTMKLKSNI